MYKSLEEIREVEKTTGKPFWKIVQEDDCAEQGIDESASFEQMRKMYLAMKNADEEYDGNLKSASGLVGTEGKKMHQAREAGTLLCGDFIGKVMEKALKTGESNACMKRIVAAPTAGACGVMPAVLVPYYMKNKKQEKKVIESMYVGAGIGQIIALRASISGAQGGCQAEIGAASAMTAGALVYLEGGDYRQIVNGAAMALKNLLGLVCDPVAGFVEVPCVKRNVIGAVNAVSSAEMALAGITSRIPPDQVIDAMREVGDKMDISLKETGKGGLAATTTGREIEERLHNQEPSPCLSTSM